MLDSIHYGRQEIDSDAIDLVSKALKAPLLTQGPVLEQFEDALKDYLGSTHCVAVSSGTSALHLAVRALGLNPGARVLVSPLTFVATANAAEYCGATVEFIDINPKTLNMDLDSLEIRLRTNKAPKVELLIVTDYAGLPCDWERLRKLADEYNFYLIGDCCHALGAAIKGDVGYAHKAADLVCYSFHPVKPITTAEGGAIVTNIEGWASTCRLLRSHGIIKTQSGNAAPWEQDMSALGFNYRLNEISATLGKCQLETLDLFILRRNQIASRYNEELADLSSVVLPPESPDRLHGYHLFPLRVKWDDVGISKLSFYDKMRTLGIQLQVHYKPVPAHSYYRKKYCYPCDAYSFAQTYYDQAFSLPIFPSLDAHKQAEVIAAIKACIN